ncbi:Twinfilin-1 [Spiromyces aspiralis]|uniref:Twinfilin-1 n=1 Tax=Spiromyces aspiralis TaxID=68401 RepID=A0ACC1HEC7_9FUNG|nr:Twinfilin-1 [Spiromyces aspiralis]
MSSRVAHVRRITISLSEECVSALRAFRDGRVNTVILKINPSDESIVLDRTESVPPEGLQHTLTESEPRFLYYRWEDEEDVSTGAVSQAIIFIYSCPVQSNVRERMLYSTFRTLLINEISKGDIGIQESTRLEVDSMDELSPEQLRESVVQFIASGSNNNNLESDISSASASRPKFGQSAGRFRRPAPPGRRRP